LHNIVRERSSNEVIVRTLKLHRVIGKFIELAYTFTGAQYEELGELDKDGNITPIPVKTVKRKVVVNEETTNESTTKEKKRFRARLSHEVPEPELRNESNESNSNDEIHTGLSRKRKPIKVRRPDAPLEEPIEAPETKRESIRHRDERLLQNSRPGKDEVGASTIRRNVRSNSSIPKWSLYSIQAT
jgi:hypothetical protein